jgi:hypothetical protein
MRLKMTNRLVGTDLAVYHGKPDVPVQAWRVT